MIEGKWSQKELEKLKEIYPTTPRKDLVKIFNRSLNSIKGAIHQHKIYKGKRFSQKIYTINNTDIELAYLAGIIDGEGCIRISKAISKKSRNPSYEGQIVIGNTDGKLIKYLHDLIGGFWTESKYKKKKSTYKDAYVLVFGQNLCRVLLPKLIPFLIVKKDQAILLLNFLETFSSAYSRRKGCDSELLDLRESQFAQMKKLKQNQEKIVKDI